LNSVATAETQRAEVVTRRRSHAFMHLLMLVVTVCWAANIVAGKEALRGFGPLALAQLRVLGAALVYGLIFLMCRKRVALRLTWHQWMTMVLLALNGVTLNQLFFIGGLARTSVSHTGLIVALGPVMVLVLACLLRLEALTVPKFVGMVISFIGVAILTADKAGGANGGYWVGDLILLAGGAVFAYYTILMKQVANQFDVLTLNTLAFGMGAFLLVPFSGHAAVTVKWATLPAEAWWGLAYMVILGSVVPYLLFAFALTELAASRVSAFSYLQPVIATGLGIWLVSERLTTKVVVGGITILLGVYLTERERGEEKEVNAMARNTR